MLCREAHMSYMLEARRRTDHRLVDLAARSRLLLLGTGRAGFGLGILGAIVDLLEEVARFAFVCEREADEALVAFE